MNTAAGVIIPYRLQFAGNEQLVRRIIRIGTEERLRTWRQARKEERDKQQEARNFEVTYKPFPNVILSEERRQPNGVESLP